MKIGDYVKVKRGIEASDGVDISHIYGHVNEIYPNDDLISIMLDSKALEALSIDKMVELENENYNCFAYNLYKSDVEPATPRESREELEKTHKKLSDKIFGILMDRAKSEAEQYDKMLDMYYRKFRISRAIEQFGSQTERVANIVNYHINFMVEQHGLKPMEWNINATKNICLSFIPKNFIAEKSFYELYGKAIIAFLEMLETDTGKSQSELIDYLYEIEDQIVIEAEK